MKKYQLEIKWALIFVSMQLLWMLGERLSGLHDEHIAQHAIWTNLVMIPAVTVYVLALRDKRKSAYNGLMTYKQGFVAGVWISIFVTLLSPLTQWLTSAVISPDYFANVSAYAVEQGKMTAEEAAAYFSMESYLKQTVLFTPVMGVITTAIVALFTRKSA
jgi:hypothetical protein